jgi:hypothetical protein
VPPTLVPLITHSEPFVWLNRFSGPQRKGREGSLGGNLIQLIRRSEPFVWLNGFSSPQREGGVPWGQPNFINNGARGFHTKYCKYREYRVKIQSEYSQNTVKIQTILYVFCPTCVPKYRKYRRVVRAQIRHGQWYFWYALSGYT